MTDPLIELQVLYEIAMSIGNSLDMTRMLKESLKTILQKLNLQQGAVFQAEEDETGFRFEYLFSIPRLLEDDPSYEESMTLLSIPYSVDELKVLYSKMPLYSRIDNSQASVLFRLEDFGVLRLVAHPDRLNEEVIESLLPLSEKLARACIACRNKDALLSENLVRLHSEKALAESEQQLRTIIDSVQTGIVILEVDTHRIIEVNRRAVELFGRPKEEIVGRLCHEWMTPKSFEECPLTGADAFLDNYECEILHPTRKSIPALKNAKVISIRNRQYILESFMDMTAIKAAEAERRRLEKLLRQSQKMEAIGTLAGGIAHDFNNLLTPIIGMIQLSIEEENLSLDLYENLQQVYQAAMRAKNLVKQILTFAHRSDETALPIEPAGIVKETLKLLRASLPATIEIVKRITGENGFLKELEKKDCL